MPLQKCRAGKRLLGGVGLAIVVGSERVYDRTDIASLAIKEAARASIDQALLLGADQLECEDEE